MSERTTLDRDDQGGKRGFHRRGLLRLAALGAGATALSNLLAACGGTPTATTAPASSTAASAAPAASSAAASSAAASAAPAASAAASARPSVAASAAPASAAASTGASAAPASAAAGGASGGQVSYHWVKPVTLHPLFSTSGAEQGVERLLFGALVKVNDKLEAVPDIAEKIDISADAKVYTFSLKKALVFTDGKPLTAADVVFTIERAVDKRVGSYWRGRLLGIDGAADFGDQKADKIKGLETPDPYTVKITLAAPDSTFLLTIGNFAGMGILPAHILKDIAPDQLSKHSFGLNPTPTAGVFQFVKYETDQYVEIKRNETYGGGAKAKLERIFAKNLTPDVALAQLDKGEIDLMIVPVAEIDRVKKNPNLTVVSVPSPSVSFMCLNQELPYFQDKRVRQAMQYAIDREAIVKEIYKGEAVVVNQTIIGPEWMGMPDLNMYKFDPNKAKQLIKDANWDTNRKIETIYTPGNKEQDAFAAIIQQQLKDIGVQIDLRQIEAAEYGRKLVQQHQYEIAFVGGGVFRQDPNVSANYFEKINWTPAGGNYAHYSNPKVDELFQKGRATPDKAERKKIYTELATILNDELPWIFLWSPNSIFGVNKRLQGFKPPSYATHQVWNAEEWSVTS
ncbi:MAG: ABC transporter substrate-binding protein [Thermomicrobiales bacterium]